MSVRPAFEYRHVVSFAETNLVGNVYFTRHLEWQGRCREMFLREHAPDVLQELSSGLVMVTLRCSCDYLAELFAFDEVLIRMLPGRFTASAAVMDFEYYRVRDGDEELVARGQQRIACMRNHDGEMLPAVLPESLRRAFELLGAPSPPGGS